MPISATDLNKAYLAYFGRPADLTGKTYFATLEQADVIKAFDASAESKALYGNDAAAKVNAIYQNLFNRNAEPEGLVYWTTLINQGRVTAAGAAFAILNGAQGTDATAVQNKLAASEAFVAAMDTTAELVGYSGLDAAASARNWLKGVTSDAASLTAAVAGAQAAVDAAVALGTGEGGAGYQLTNGTDVASANVFTAGLVYTPGGDDRINSLQDEDRLTGTGPDTTLNATLGNANDNGGTVITPTLVNMNTINAAFTGSGGGLGRVNTLDLQDATGVKAVNITRISDNQNAAVNNITSAASQLSVKNSQAPSGNVDFTFLASAVAGAADSTTLTLSNVNAGRVRVEQNSATPTQGFETINLVSTGSANTVGVLRAEDLQTLNISGTQNLNLGTRGATLNGQSAEAARYGDVFRNADGSLTKIDASAFEGRLDMTLGSQFNAGLDGTSGVNVRLTVIGGKGDDTFRIADGAIVGGTVATRDDIDGGEGNNKLVVGGNTQVVAAGTAAAPVANVKNIQALEVRTGHDDNLGADAPIIDANAFDKLSSIYVRNEGQSFIDTNGDLIPDTWVSANESAAVTLNNLTAAQATAITLAHGTTGNSNIANNAITANLKTATGAADTVGLTIVDGTNTDPIFNAQLVAGGGTAATRVENVTLTDSDTESNTVRLVNFDQHIGTVTVAGGAANQYFNLDSGATQPGSLYEYAVDGTPAHTVSRAGIGGDTNAPTLVVADVGAGAQNRLVAATFDASGSASDVIVRLNTSMQVDVGDALKETANGGQKVLMGEGNDTVIFDKLNDTTAGLTISDTVAGGEGKDTLVIDGHGVKIDISASEWTNVTGFETLRLIGNGVAADNSTIGVGVYAGNSYNLTLTNEFIEKNSTESGNNRLIAIVNDNDATNDAGPAAGLAGAGGVNGGVNIDARTLSSTRSFSYNGEEGASNTADRFILSDANINGVAQIDGGFAVFNKATANADILEVRNAAVVTVGDLSGLKNIGTLEFTNDTSVTQKSTLVLNNDVLDALVNSSHIAKVGEVETLTVNVTNGAVSSAVTVVDINTTDVDFSKFDLVINYTDSLGAVQTATSGVDNFVGSATEAGAFNLLAGDDSFIGNAADVKETVNGGLGNDTITGGGGADVLTGGAGVDEFAYAAAADSTSGAGAAFAAVSAGFDKITGLVLGNTATSDKLNLSGVVALGNLIADASGAINAATFRTDFDALASTAAAGDYQVITANAGNLAGRSWLLCDVDGDGALTDGVDVVIEITGATGTLAVGDVI